MGSLVQLVLILAWSGAPVLAYKLATGAHVGQGDIKGLCLIGGVLAAVLAFRVAELRLKGLAQLYGEIVGVTTAGVIGYLFSPWAPPGADGFTPRGWGIGLGLWLVLTAVALLGAVAYRRNQAAIRDLLGRPGPWLRGVIAPRHAAHPRENEGEAFWPAPRNGYATGTRSSSGARQTRQVLSAGV